MAVEVIEIKDANGVTQRVYVDKIGTDNVQVIKPGFGADDTLTLVTSTSGLPVNVVAGSAAGTEYTEGNTDATITGPAILWEDAADTLRPVSAAKPLPTQIISGATAISAGEAHIGEVGGRSTVVTPAITVSTSIYAAGDSIGGKLTLSNAVRISSGTGVLQDILLSTNDGEQLACRILLFDSNTTAATADNAAFAFGTGDRARLLAIVDVAASEWFTIGGVGICHKQGLGIVVAANGSSSLYAFILATGTPTFTATSDLTVRFKFLND